MAASSSDDLVPGQTAFRPVSLRVLRLEEVADFAIYTHVREGDRYVLYRERSLPFTQEAKARLIEAGVERVYVTAAERRHYLQYVERNLNAILDDGAVPPEEKAGLLYESLVNVVEDVLADPRAGDVIPRSRNVVESSCKFLYGHTDALAHLMKVVSFDYYTFTHSVNVFVFAMALAQRVFPKERLMNEFGMGALLHDLGKSRIDPAIVNAKGRLTPEQFDTIKLHPVYSYELLKERPGIHPVTLDMARHHHERIQGGGYPDAISGDAVIREVRALTIADIFDALTTRRSYKDPMKSFHALKLMRDEMQDQVDPELFVEFVRLIGKPDGG